MKDAVLITGAAGALGRAVTRYFLDHDVPVVAIAGPTDDSDYIQHELLTVYAGDLSGESTSRSVFEKAVKSDLNISMAVFIAGGFGMGSFRETSLENIREMFSLNFETAYTSARFMYEHFIGKGGGGRMVFIGARPGLEPGQAANMAAYGLSKSLIFSLAELINGAGRKEGIDAAVIVPSIIDTPGNRKGMPDADFRKWVRPGHIAESIYFLYSEAGRELKETVFKIYGES